MERMKHPVHCRLMNPAEIFNITDYAEPLGSNSCVSEITSKQSGFPAFLGICIFTLPAEFFGNVKQATIG
jgi:hypothetical protein